MTSKNPIATVSKQTNLKSGLLRLPVASQKIATPTEVKMRIIPTIDVIINARECSAASKTVSRHQRCGCRNGKCSRQEQRRFSLSYSLKFFGGREGQAAFAVEQFLQPPVAETRLAPVDSGRNELAQLTAVAPPFQPVGPTDRAFNRNRRDFWF